MVGTQLERLLERAEQVLERVESVLPSKPASPDWDGAIAFRWRRHGHGAELVPVLHPHRIRVEDLQCVDDQKALILRNTRQFVAGAPANNVLLWGSRGTGKSSLIKAMLDQMAEQGLRLIEVDKHDLIDLPDIVELVHGRPEHFIVFCDDLSFEADDPSYKALKAILDGSINGPPTNILIYATSNRRHLLPEYMHENHEARNVGNEIHYGDATEEKISLSERFGLWVSFYPFNQDGYLAIVDHWLGCYGVTGSADSRVRTEALKWALTRGSRSGRSAYQFALDWAGRTQLGDT